MRDLTSYSDTELSLIVFNDEYLYSIRHLPNLMLQVIDETFIYTTAQLEELRRDLADDLEGDAE